MNSIEYFRLLDSRFCAHDQKHRGEFFARRKRVSELYVCLKLHFLLIVVCRTSHTSVFIWRLFHSDANTKEWWWLIIISRDLKSLSIRENFHNQLICEFNFFSDFYSRLIIFKKIFFSLSESETVMWNSSKAHAGVWELTYMSNHHLEGN